MASPQEIGRLLREQRELRSLSLEEAAFSTHIRSHYLKAIEDGSFHLLPSPSQGKGFIRLYAGYLGLNPDALLADDQLEENLSSSPVRESSPVLPEKVSENNSQAEAIFAEIGHKLRRHREMLGISLEEVERHTRLRSHYLTALESGDFGKLPSPVQGRGMLSNYAVFLGLDADQVLLRYAEGLQAQLMARKEAELAFEKAKKSRKGKKSRSTESEKPLRSAGFFSRLLSPDSLVGAVLVLALIGFVIWGALRITTVRSSSADLTSTPTAPSIADVLLGAGTITPSVDPAAAGTPGLAVTTPSATIPAPLQLPSETLDGSLENGTPVSANLTPSSTVSAPESGGAVQVYIAIRQRAWVRVIVDGEVAFDDRVVPGSIYQYSAQERIEVITGNAAALQVFYNQVDQGILGGLGEVVNVVYSAGGAATPTLTATPTGGPTGRVPLTPTPSSTATPPRP